MKAAKNGKGSDVLEMLKGLARYDKEHKRSAGSGIKENGGHKILSRHNTSPPK